MILTMKEKKKHTLETLISPNITQKLIICQFKEKNAQIFKDEDIYIYIYIYRVGNIIMTDTIIEEPILGLDKPEYIPLCSKKIRSDLNTLTNICGFVKYAMR